MAISVALPIPALRFSDYFFSSTPISVNQNRVPNIIQNKNEMQLIYFLY